MKTSRFRRLGIWLVVIVVCFMTLHVPNTKASSSLTTKVNGKTYSLKTIQYSSTWYIPIDAAMQAQNVKGSTGKTSYRATLSNGTKIIIYINKTTAKMGSKTVALVTKNGKNASKKAILKNKKVYVPLTFAKNHLNVSITQGSSSINIAKKKSSTTNSSGTTTSDSTVKQILTLVNEERKKAGVSALTLNTKATAAANVRAKEIVSSFSHTRPSGKSFSTALTAAGVSYQLAGENIAAGQDSAKAVMTSWMNSSGHRANILKSSYKQMGVGYYKDASGKKYWVQLFIN